MKRIFTLGLAVSLFVLTAASCCFAANYDYKTMTPDIEKALENRQARYYQLQSLKQEGVIGENNKGYVTDLKGSASSAAMTDAENLDRRVIYEALAEQNKLGTTGLLEVQKAFAGAVDNLTKNAPAGSESAVAAFKNALTAGQTAIESAQTQAKKAVETAQSNFAAATTQTVDAVKKATKKA